MDLADAARVSRSTISRLELGGADDLTLRTIDAIASALAARLEVRINWNGEALDRLLDAEHASLVETVAVILQSFGWDVAVEVSFSLRGERGSIDVLAFHPSTRTILVVEVKSVVADVQATLVVLDRKTRLAAEIARQRGWVGRGVSRVLVIADRRTARRRVASHQTVFAAAFPHRNVSIRRWLRNPDPGNPLSGLWFLSDARVPSARHRVAARRQPRTLGISSSS